MKKVIIILSLVLIGCAKLYGKNHVISLGGDSIWGKTSSHKERVQKLQIPSDKIKEMKNQRSLRSMFELSSFIRCYCL